MNEEIKKILAEVYALSCQLEVRGQQNIYLLYHIHGFLQQILMQQENVDLKPSKEENKKEQEG